MAVNHSITGSNPVQEEVREEQLTQFGRVFCLH